MTEKEVLEVIEEAARDGRTELSSVGKGIESLPREIGELTELRKLHLHYNRLKILPAELGKLTEMREISLTHNSIRSLPAELWEMTKLRRLNLGANGLKSLPAGLGKLVSLTDLNLWGNQLASLPPEIGELTELRKLHVQGNQLKNLPAELGRLTKLTELWVNNNELRSLPAELGKLTKLIDLEVSGNPLESPPREIVVQGRETILAYLRGLRRGEREEWSSKVIFVGEGGVGKTSLLKRLLGEEFDSEEETTHGLKVRQLQMDHPKETDVSMVLNAWDFGGQYILHATHQFFLTERALFVLVWNARHGWQQGKVHYWLDMIKARAPEARVLIVATHTEDWPAALPYEDICDKHPQVCGEFAVSNEQGTGIGEVMEALRTEAADLPLMGISRPAVWLDVAEAVREVRKTKRYIYPNELDAIMEGKVIEVEDRGILSKWLHDLGDMLYFKENSELCDMVILDAEWVASNVSRMLEDAEIEKGLGIFKKEHMEAVWPGIEPPVRNMFLRLMEQFDLSFRTLEDEDISIVVERLSLNASESAEGYEEMWDERKGEGEVTLKYYLDTSLPPGIPTWFIARSHRFTTYKHWRYGALFADGKELKQLGLVRAYDHERYLTLSARGPAPHNFHALLRDGLELTLGRYPGLEIKRKIPCPGHGGKSCPYEFNLRLVERALGKRRSTVECHESGDDVAVSQLLYGLDMRDEGGVMIRLDALSKQVRESAGETQEVVSERVDALEGELVTDLGVILTELVELRKLAEREFLSQFNRNQRLEESHCPNVFAVLPKDEERWRDKVLGRKMVMQLYCQAPGCWHPAVEGKLGGRYEIKRPSEFLGSMGPYILKLAKVIRYAAPVGGATAGMAAAGVGGAVIGAETAKRIAAEIKLMEELAKKLAGRDYSEAELLERTGVGGKAERIEGMELRGLRVLLDEVDPHHEWGGLRKVLTPEGHYLWLCEAHAAEYRS